MGMSIDLGTKRRMLKATGVSNAFSEFSRAIQGSFQELLKDTTKNSETF